MANHWRAVIKSLRGTGGNRYNIIWKVRYFMFIWCCGSASHCWGFGSGFYFDVVPDPAPHQNDATTTNPSGFIVSFHGSYGYLELRHLLPIQIDSVMQSMSNRIWREFGSRSSHIFLRLDWCWSTLGCTDAAVGRTGGLACKVSFSRFRATGRSWVQSHAAILAWLG